MTNEEHAKKICELLEEEIVSVIASKLVTKPGIGEHLFYPEDARDLIPRGPRIIYSIDAYSINSLKLPWRTYSDIGWTSLTGAVSDVLSKGGIPHASLIALGLTCNTNLGELVEFVNGLLEAAKHYHVKILGGDTNYSLEDWIAVTVLGFTSAKIPPSRGGMRPGDYIIVTGVYGAMGYLAIHGIEKSISEKWVIDLTKRPISRIETGYVIGEYYRLISATMDVSDGLGYTLYTMSALSGYGIDIETPPRTPPQILSICGENIRCMLDYTLIGGEEYGVVIVVKPKGLDNIVKELEHFKIDFEIIGRVIDTLPGVFHKGERLSIKRYDQFKKWH
ncbi:MAG: thiamine-phosphate kinase [Desulfurococcaceae archaeon]